MEPDDYLLLARISVGDEAALQELYLRYLPRLRRYLWYELSGDHQAVEDVLQDIFVAVWRGATGFRGEAKIATWIFQIAYYSALHARRAMPLGHGTADSLPDDDDARATGAVQPPADDAILDRLVFADAVQQLSDKHQAVLRLIFAEGFALDEVARILNVPHGTVKSRLSYARRALLRALTTSDTEATHL